MSDKRQKLNRKLVEGLDPAPKDLFLWDSEVVGFGVRVRPGGHRGYILQYRFAGRARQYQIGGHGETARERAKVLQGLVASGEDPQESKAGARKELSVAQLCDLYLAEGLATRKETSMASARSNVENHIKPLIGTKRAALVTRQDVEYVLAPVAARKTRRTAATAKKRVSPSSGAARAPPIPRW